MTPSMSGGPIGAVLSHEGKWIKIMKGTGHQAHDCEKCCFADSTGDSHDGCDQWKCVPEMRKDQGSTYYQEVENVESK